MKHLLLILLLPVFCYGQGDQTIIKVPLDASGTTEQAILHLPDDYNSTSTKYPIMIFLHGMGEGGGNPATIYGNGNAGGPAYYIAQKTFPSSFVNPVDKKSYKYIIVSPQSTNGWSTTAAQMDYVIKYLVNTYRVDQTRLYLTGLSAGGEGITEYVGRLDGNGAKVNRSYKIAAFIPMSAVMNAGERPQYGQTIVSENIQIWGFGSATDVHGANTLNLVKDYVNTIKANYGLVTAYSGGHCCWGQFYNPAFTQNGMNIYQWALQYTQGTAAPSSSVPTANAGANQSVTLPVNNVVLNGTGSSVSGGTVASYGWTLQSGPATPSIAAPASATTTVTGLVGGTYVFKLTIKDNNGNTSSATTQATVNAAAVVTPPGASLAIPGKVEAESYSAMNGIETQGTTDAGGGTNVGWIDQGNWMDYKVNAATAGTYAVGFRIATPYSGVSFQVRSSSGAVLATISPAATGGFQNWQTVSTTLTLPAGSQTLRIYSSGSPEWNLNWMQFAAGSGQPIPGTVQAETYNNMSGINTQTTTDAGGGKNVGWIDQGDWIDYNVNAVSSGTYTVSFRVASIYSTSFQLRSSSGATLATISFPATGGFQTWKTLNATVTLPAGSQTLRIYSSGSAEWNLNWMQFATGTTGAAADQKVMTATSESLLNDSSSPLITAASTLVLYPNPVQGAFTVQLNNEYMGNMRVQITDITGVTRQVVSYNKNQSSVQVSLSAANLPAGTYFVRVQIGTWSEVKKIVKL